jgi:hypothetical protein
MKHLAWDEGVIDQVFVKAFGPSVIKFVGSKTTKTFCGKRVSSSQIDNKNFSCPDCEQKWLEQSLLADSINDSFAEMGVNYL